MLIYRLEHTTSGIGPYEHDNRDQSVLHLLCNSTSVVADVIEYEQVKHILKLHPEAVFGFSNKQWFNKFVPDLTTVLEYGFVPKVYDLEPLIVIDNQAIFIKNNTN